MSTIDWLAVTELGHSLADQVSRQLREGSADRVLSGQVRYEFADAFGHEVRFVLLGKMIGGEVRASVVGHRSALGTGLSDLGEVCEALTKRCLKVRAIEFI